jgi:hypothetical protein
LKFAWQAKFGKITIQSINRVVMLTFQNLILCYDVARLAVNDVNFGDEAVCLCVILNHIYNLNQNPENARKTFNCFIARNDCDLGGKLARNLYALCHKSLYINDLGDAGRAGRAVTP